MTTELLAPLDLAFWHLESPDHPMHLGALAVFEAAPDAATAPGARTGADDEALLDLLATRAAAVPRLRMRVRDVLLPVGGAAWSVDKDFDVRRHVRHLALPPGDFAEETARLAGELMEQPLERGIPPWEMYVLTGGDGDGVAERVGRRFAVLVKLHHALADGMRAVAIGAGIFDQIADARAAGTRRARPAPPRSWLPGPGQVAGLARERIGDLGRALGIGASVVRASRLDLRGTPALTAGSSGTRRLATAVLALEDVRQVRKAHGGTVNDVLLATVAGALRRWMLERGEQLPDRDPRTDPRALVPVSGRRPSRARQAASGAGGSGSGNVLSAYLLGLPVSEPDPLSRLTAVRHGMDRNKKDGPSRGAGAVAVLAGQLHPLAHRLGAPLAGNAARILFDVLVTSVPLPRATLSFGGCPLREIYPMAPLARGQSLAVGLTTYGGQVHVGLVADGKAVPDLGGLAKHMNEELTVLLHLPAPAEPTTGTGRSADPSPSGRVASAGTGVVRASARRPAGAEPAAAVEGAPDSPGAEPALAVGPVARAERAVDPASSGRVASAGTGVVRASARRSAGVDPAAPVEPTASAGDAPDSTPSADPAPCAPVASAEKVDVRASAPLAAGAERPADPAAAVESGAPIEPRASAEGAPDSPGVDPALAVGPVARPERPVDPSSSGPVSPAGTDGARASARRSAGAEPTASAAGAPGSTPSADPAPPAAGAERPAVPGETHAPTPPAPPTQLALLGEPVGGELSR